MGAGLPRLRPAGRLKACGARTYPRRAGCVVSFRHNVRCTLGKPAAIGGVKPQTVCCVQAAKSAALMRFQASCCETGAQNKSLGGILAALHAQSASLVVQLYSGLKHLCADCQGP